MRRSRRENLRLHGMGKGTGRIGCGALGRPGAVLPGVCRLIAAYGASWKGDSARLTHPIATPSLPRRGDAQMGTRGHGGGGVRAFPLRPGSAGYRSGTAALAGLPPARGFFLGGEGFVALWAGSVWVRVLLLGGWVLWARGESVTPGRQRLAAPFETMPKRCPNAKPRGSRAMGKEKPPRFGTRLRAATTGPMGSPSAALSHPACPEQTRPKGPAA